MTPDSLPFPSSGGGGNTCEVLAPEKLDQSSRSEWIRLQKEIPGLRNPYFRPEYVEAVSRHREGVEIVVARKEGRPIAFWPFQRLRRGIAGPVGGNLGCLHGIITDDDRGLDLLPLAEAAGLRGWVFDHLPASQVCLSPSVAVSVPAPYIDVEEGFEAFLDSRKASGHSNRNILNCDRKLRKLEREVGPVTFDPDTSDPAILQSLVRWKKEQFRATGRPDIFLRDPSILPLLEDLLALEDDRFRATIAAVSVAGEPVAALCSLRSEEVLHGLFLGFDRSFAPYSPGIATLVEMTKRARETGVARIELGKGSQAYKRSLMSGVHLLGEGRFDVSPVRASLHRLLHRGKKALSRSALGGPFRRIRGEIQRGADRVGRTRS